MIQEIWVGGGGQKTLPSVGGVWIFSGITHFANERRLNPAARNALFLPLSQLLHKYSSHTGTSHTIYKADITENDCLRV